VVLALLAMSLSACGTAPSKLAGAACPSLPVYAPDIQTRAADELDAMPDGSIIKGVFMPDYGRMRDGVRACLKAQERP
jgi:hypothetical protein